MPYNNKNISVIIPVLNEAEVIEQVLTLVNKSEFVKEILVVDGGSTDGTVEIARKCNASVILSKKGRAKQMNAGAAMATGSVFYFLHVDSIPPKNFDTYIIKAMQTGSDAGCFRMQFDSPSWFLKFFAWFTKFNFLLCRGGDQSLFIKAKVFRALRGFDENYVVYEDNEFVGRIYKSYSFKVMPAYIVTSARKYNDVGQYKLQYYFGVIHLKYLLGEPPIKLRNYYVEKLV